MPQTKNPPPTASSSPSCRRRLRQPLRPHRPRASPPLRPREARRPDYRPRALVLVAAAPGALPRAGSDIAGLGEATSAAQPAFLTSATTVRCRTWMRHRTADGQRRRAAQRSPTPPRRSATCAFRLRGRRAARSTPLSLPAARGFYFPRALAGGASPCAAARGAVAQHFTHEIRGSIGAVEPHGGFLHGGLA